MTDPTDPAKALREWCAGEPCAKEIVKERLNTGRERDEKHGRTECVAASNAALDTLSSAPALLAALARLEKAEGLLREALPYVASAAEKQHGYGHFPGGDPRKFTPDEDGTLPEERKAWEEACAKAENVAPAGEWIPAGEGHGGIHVTWQRFGLGVYTYRDEEAVAAKAAIDAFLAPAPASGDAEDATRG